MPLAFYLLFSLTLGAESFAAREVAQRELDMLGPPWRPVLELLAQHPEPEVACRAEAALGRVVTGLALAGRLLPEGWRVLPWGPSDWIDYRHYDERRDRALHGPPDWCHYRLATAALVRSMALAGYNHRAILAELDRLAESDRAWCHAHDRLCAGDNARRLR